MNTIFEQYGCEQCIQMRTAIILSKIIIYYHNAIVTQMNQQCPICDQVFHWEFNPPYVLCQRQHSVCRFCYYCSMKALKAEKCPICRESKKITIFYPYQQCERQLVQSQTAQDKEIYQTKKQIFANLDQLIGFDNTSQGQIYLFIRMTAISMMKSYEYQSASLLLRKIIESNTSLADRELFIGLGMLEEESSLHFDRGYGWYQDQFGKNISLYDLLGICYLKFSFDQEEIKQWYDDMHAKNPQNFGILFGLGVTLLNANQFSSALKIFDSLSQMNASFSKSYQAKLIIYYLTGQFERMKSMAIFLLNIQPNNMQAKHYLAINPINNDQVCSGMRQILKISPTFSKSILILGGQIEDYQKSMKFYQESLSIIPNCIEAKKWLGSIKYKAGQYIECGRIHIDVLKYKKLSKRYKSMIFRFFGKLDDSYRQFDSALDFYRKAYSLSNQSWNIAYSDKIASLYRLGYFQEVIEGGKETIRMLKLAMPQLSPQRNVWLKNCLSLYYYYVGDTYFLQKQYNNVIHLLKQWEKIDPFDNVNYLKLMKSQSQFFEKGNSIYHIENCKKWYSCCLAQNYQLEKACKIVVQSLCFVNNYEQAILILDSTILNLGSCPQLLEYKSRIILKNSIFKQ